MKIIIFGSGGVGGYFGGRLAQHGQDVTFIARGAHLKAIRETGLRVDSVDGDFAIHPAKATDDIASIGAADLILLAVKAWQLDDAIAQTKPMVGEQTMILPLMNGMEHMQTLLSTFGAKHVLGGLSRISAYIEAPGHIRHVGIQPYIAFGEWDNTKSGRIQNLVEMFKLIKGVTAENPPDIQTAMWEKFIFICAVSGVGAYIRLPIGEIRANPETRAMLQNVLEETTALARARGVAIVKNFVETTMSRIENIAPHVIPSMQKDMMEGRPSELNEQTGAVVRMGRAAGIPTPTHEKILAELLPLEQKARNL
jgi:2-dehydropantoate 2-reductase